MLRLRKALSPIVTAGDLHRPGAIAAFAAKTVFKGIVLAIGASLMMLCGAGALGILPFPFPGVIIYSVIMCWLIGGVVFYAIWRPLNRHILRLTANQAKFELLSRTDPLSGLLNRRGFNAEFELQDRDASLAIFDIDRFKMINDVHGHVAGDLVISTIARSFKRILGSDHCIARLGGEEFAVIIRGETLSERMDMVEKLRNRISACPVHFQGLEISLTISAGVAEFSSGRRKEHIYTAADRALYLAKTAGRNRAMHEIDLPVMPRMSACDLKVSSDPVFPFVDAKKYEELPRSNVS